MDNKFNEEDQKKIVEFLNFVATNAVWKELDTKKVIEYFKLLQFMQSVLLKKVDANILEVKQVVQLDPAAASAEEQLPKPARGKKSS